VVHLRKHVSIRADSGANTIGWSLQLAACSFVLNVIQHFGLQIAWLFFLSHLQQPQPRPQPLILPPPPLILTPPTPPPPVAPAPNLCLASLSDPHHLNTCNPQQASKNRAHAMARCQFQQLATTHVYFSLVAWPSVTTPLMQSQPKVVHAGTHRQARPTATGDATQSGHAACTQWRDYVPEQL